MAQYGLIMPSASAHFTHPRLQIRTAQDAHRVFEAVRQGILPLIRRRLSPSERDLLSSGQVFVWEEAPTGSAAGDETSQTTSGLERWTDGRRWSQSRMREPFLFYEEKVQTTAEEKQAKADRRARKASSSDSQAASAAALLPLRRQDRPSKPDGLTKQTYSSYVILDPDLPSSSPFSAAAAAAHAHPHQPVQRKWHCVAYFSAADWNNLPSVDAYIELKNVVVPDGVYTSTKGTGKTGGPPPAPFHSDELAIGIGARGSVGPIRRPMSRGNLSSSPYTTPGGGVGPTSPCSTSSMSDDPRSPTSCDSPISYHPYPSRNNSATPHAQMHTQHRQSQAGAQTTYAGLHPNSQSFPHHQHSSSTSSVSTGSPPTPGFMAPIPSPSSFTSPAGAPLRKSSSSSSSSSQQHAEYREDVIMLDAPTLRTPTKDYPHAQHKSPMDTEYFASTSSGSSTSSGTPLPSFSSILGQSRSSGPTGRSREDSMALGAFRLAL